jgi:hypothetical protein
MILLMANSNILIGIEIANLFAIEYGALLGGY